MRLKTVRLHPFGRFTDESWNLDRPLVVILGPNELGKTTLRQAVCHALFTPTKQTSAQFRDTVRPWQPQPGGDHAVVTLTFEHGGSTWTLVKRWGAEPSSLLTDGTTVVGDAANVQQRLAEILTHNEATFRHVLFTGQAELEQTLVAIDKNSNSLRDVRDLVRAGGGVAGDVDEQRLRRKLDEKIDAAFGRWNDERNEPERQANGQERGLANPWINKVGHILEAWYAWKALAAEHDDVLRLERELDHVNREVANQERIASEAAVFIGKYGHLQKDLTERGVLEERVVRLEQDVRTLTGVFRGWPEADAAIKAWAPRKVELDAMRAALDEELAVAEKRRDGTAARDAFGRVEAAKRAWEEATAAAETLPSPGKDQVDAIERLHAAIIAAENKLAARKLTWRIEAEKTGTVRIERGIEEAEMLACGPEAAGGTADARVRVSAGGITLTVDSGDDDVGELFRSLAADRKLLAEMLEASGVKARDELRLRVENRRAADATVNERKAAFTAALGGRTFEQWQAAVKTLDELPNTRDIETIKKKIEIVRTRIVSESAMAETHRASVAAWIKVYGDQEGLAEKLLAGKADLKKEKEKLSTLATLPEEFDSSQTLLAKLALAQQSQLDAQKQLTSMRTSGAELTGAIDERRSQDLAEAADMARRRFERARAEGRAYRWIKQELDRITADAEIDPLVGFGAKVAAIFSRITGGEATLEFDGQLPAQVVRGPVALPPDRLSHGGGGALALAVRLALAEAYLAHGGGFLMFDDPLVHFDATRMAIATEILREVSERAQVIFFTCHDHHAMQFEK